MRIDGGRAARGVSAILVLGFVLGSVAVLGDRLPARADAPGARAAAAPPLTTLRMVRSAGGRQATVRERTVLREGIDVSHWQDRIDWGRVARSGVDFAWVKASEGTGLVDRRYRRNVTRARAAGIRVGAYHFAVPEAGVRDARRQADHLVRTAQARPGDLVPALDLEVDGGLSRGALRRWTVAFLARVETRLGVRPVLYTSPGFASAELAGVRSLARDHAPALWVAHWGTRRPDLPGDAWAGRGWSFWQWTDRGQVPGISGPVDRNLYSGPALRTLTIGARRAAAERRSDGVREDAGERGSRDERGRAARGRG